MQWNKITSLGLCLMCSTWVYSQSGESVPTSLNPVVEKTTSLFSPTRKAEKVFTYKQVNVKHTAQYEFYERVEKAAKARKKLLKKLAKPQYSNPLFFGHKHKPKKRPPHKMKYCEVCGIRH